jgi:RTX calcium-binding nonapeptide repeat (4 copies)/WD40-like Beta Propeller Repeat
VHIRRLTVALVAAVTAATAGAATNSAGPQLLTYAVAPMYAGGGGWLSLGMCATDLQGKTFRLSDPHYNAGPSWSPDGRSIAFLGPADPPGQDHAGDLFVTDAQGRHPHNLTRNGGRGSTHEVFGWSPDGSELGANWSGYFNSVFIAKADGTGGRLLADATYGAYVVGESWSPDGRQILLSRSIFANPVPAISVIDVDGTNERKLIDAADRAAWSPDGQRFAYVSYTNGRASGLGVAQADGGNAHLLLQGVSLIGRPTWSPDGGRLAYVQSSDGINGGLGVIRADGSDAHALADGVIDTPQWAPDGSLIAFTRGPRRAPRVAVIKPDGSGEQDLAAAFDPVWRVPAPLPSHRRPCVVRGTSRADVIHGTSRGDVILAGRGADRVYGDGGPDVLVGGLGPDRLFGGGRADVFGARDRTRDYVFGGPGSDTAYVDLVDVRSTLETVH